MTKTVQHISLKKSAIVGKAPAKDVLAEGELAVNYGEGGEKIFLQNTKKDIVEFSADKLLDKKYLSTTSGGTVGGDTEFKGDVKIVYPDSSSQTVSLRETMVENEMAISAALNDLNTRVNDQKTDIDTIKAKECLPLSGGTINGGLTVTGNTEFKGDVKIVYPDSSSQTVSLREVMVDNEEVTSAALNELNERISEQKTDIDTIKAQECLPLSGGTVSGETTFTKEVKVVFPNSETPTSLVSAIVDNEKVTAAALNNLNTKINDQKSYIDSIKVQDSLPLSGGTVSGETTFTKDVKIKYPTIDSEPVSLRDVMIRNEKVTAASLNDLNDKFDNYLPSSGGTVSSLTILNNNLYIFDANNKKYRLNLDKLIELSGITQVEV